MGVSPSRGVGAEGEREQQLAGQRAPAGAEELVLHVGRGGEGLAPDEAVGQAPRDNLEEPLATPRHHHYPHTSHGRGASSPSAAAAAANDDEERGASHAGAAAGAVTANDSVIITDIMQPQLSSSLLWRGVNLEITVTAPVKSATGRRLKVSKCKLGGGGAVLKGGGRRDSSSFVDIGAMFEAASGTQLDQVTVTDSRATQLLVVPEAGKERFWVVPAREPFTRHTGTCIGLGDRTSPGVLHDLKLGDLIRCGSVGLLVNEMHDGTHHSMLSNEQLYELAMDNDSIPHDLFNGQAFTAQDERRAHRRGNRQGNRSRSHTSHSSGLRMIGESDDDSIPSSEEAEGAGDTDREVEAQSVAEVETLRQCYMCFEGEETPDDPLVAPCECRGDTRYVHMRCLQRWHASKHEDALCIVSNQQGAQVCGICKTAYKSHVRLLGGAFQALLRPDLRPPYISLTVCTRHATAESLFSTRFHVSFDAVMNRARTSCTRGVLLGRSHACDMVIDYRTVSTHHALLHFSHGKFQFQDLRSSNGSFLYVRSPVALPWGESLKLRWGKSFVQLKATRPPVGRLMASARGIAGRRKKQEATLGEDHPLALLNLLASAVNNLRHPMEEDDNPGPTVRSTPTERKREEAMPTEG